MVNTCQSLRVLSKKRASLGRVCDGILKASLLVLKKAILMNEEAIYSIRYRKNRFDVPEFEKFLDQEISEKILEALLKDNSLYYKLLNHFIGRYLVECNLSTSKEQTFVSLMESKSTRLSDVIISLKTETYYLADFLERGIKKIPQDLLGEF